MAYLLLLAVATFAQTSSLEGHYKMVSLSCQKAEDATTLGNTQSDDVRFGRYQSVIQIAANQIKASRRAFTFNDYGSDSCTMVTTRTFTIEHDILSLQLRQSTPSSVGEYGPLACGKVPKSADTERVRFSVQGKYLYLSSADVRAEKLFCKQGVFYTVYEKMAQATLPDPARPTVGPEESRLKLALKDSSSSLTARQEYIEFLLRERRVREADVQVNALLKINPQNEKAREWSVLVERYKNEPSADKKAQLLAEATLRDLNQLATKMQAFAQDPKIQELAKKGAVIRQARENDLLKRYPVANLKAAQYQASLDEVVLSASCIQARVNDPAEGKAKMVRAFADWPRSPFMLVQYITFMANAGDFELAIRAFDQHAGAYKDQLALMIVRDRLNSIRKISEPSERAAVASLMTDDIRTLAGLLRLKP